MPQAKSSPDSVDRPAPGPRDGHDRLRRQPSAHAGRCSTLWITQTI